jgi:hypothetical protein
MCIGCKQCEGACAQQNKLPYDDAVAAESVQSEHKYTVVLTEEDKFMRRLCMHSEHPACASELTTWVIFSDFFGCFTPSVPKSGSTDYVGEHSQLCNQTLCKSNQCDAACFINYKGTPGP